MNLSGFYGHRGSFALLFACLVGTFVLIPFVQGYPFAEEIIAVAFSLMLLVMIWLFETGSAHRRRNVAFGCVVLLSNLAAYFTPYVVIDNLSLLLNMLYFSQASALVIRRVFNSGSVTRDTILGAVCVYMLIGIIWGMGYTLLDALMPHSFSFPPDEHTVSLLDGLVRHFLYYSFVSLSTLGYGDIAPLSTPARYFSALEGIAGQMYLSILVARLVGMHIIAQR